MARSSLTFVANGIGPYSILALDYLSTSHLSVTVNGVSAPATFDTSKGTMTLTNAPAAGATVVVQRTTPRTEGARLTQFLSLASGSAGLTAALLDQDYRQLMLAAGEARDVIDGLSTGTGLGLAADTNWFGQNKKIINLSAGASPGDAIAKAQLDAAAAAARPLPTVSGADNDDGLFVTAGDFAKRTPAQARVHLGLGTAATLNAGVAANNVPQFDASSPPRYPTADGRNIDLTNHAIQTSINQRALATVLQLTRIGQAGNSLNPDVSTWSQNSTSRFTFSGTSWTNRVELNNSAPDINANFTAPNGRFDFTAGTYRIRWMLKIRQTSTNLHGGFRITNNDDTSGQIIYVDYPVFNIKQQFNATHQYYAVFLDEILMGSGSAFSLVFRWAIGTSGANNDADLSIFVQKISTSVIA